MAIEMIAALEKLAEAYRLSLGLHAVAASGRYTDLEDVPPNLATLVATTLGTKGIDILAASTSALAIDALGGAGGQIIDAMLAGMNAAKLTGTIDPARLPVIPSGEQVISSGDIAALTLEQQDAIGKGTLVTTIDGRRWVYIGTGPKTDSFSYIELADTTPEWSIIANKPAFGTAALRDEDFFTAGGRVVRVSDYATEPLAATAAYDLKAMMVVRASESVKLICNPTLGDDFEAMCAWISAGHMVERGGELFLELADGLHYVDTQVSVFGGRQLDIRASAEPDQRTITGISFVNVSGNVYDATITVSSAVPAQAVAGNVVGLYDVQGDGGAGAVNGGHVLQSVAGDGLSFIVRLRVTGVVPINPTALTTGLTPVIGGMGTNLAIFPKATLQADQAGWDGGGAPYEGFMEARSGGRIALKYIGVAYDAVTTGADANSDDDMFFAHGNGSEIALVDQCVIGGTGEMSFRSFNNGHIFAYRACLGGGDTGVNFWQGSYGGTALFQRSMLGSVSGIGISASASSKATVDKCVLAGANQVVRTTYATACVTVTNSRLVDGNYALVPTRGIISIDDTSLIDGCVFPMSMAGGELWGNPVVTNCTNPVPTGNVWDANGGAWHKTTGGGTSEISSSRMIYIGTASQALDFPSIAAASWQDLTIAVPGAAIGNAVTLARQATWPAQGVLYFAFVSAADTVTVRAYNITGAAIDPANATWKVTVFAMS